MQLNEQEKFEYQWKPWTLSQETFIELHTAISFLMIYCWWLSLFIKKIFFHFTQLEDASLFKIIHMPSFTMTWQWINQMKKWTQKRRSQEKTIIKPINKAPELQLNWIKHIHYSHRNCSTNGASRVQLLQGNRKTNNKKRFYECTFCAIKL